MGLIQELFFSKHFVQHGMITDFVFYMAHSFFKFYKELVLYEFGFFPPCIVTNLSV